MLKGGARAVDFNRSGGFTIDSVSKSGTNDWHVDASYQLQTAGMTDDLETGSSAEFERDRDWTTLGVSGPLWREHLLLYASYYRPTIEGSNRANLYGSVPDYENTRDELFGKLTWTPTASILLNGSFRTPSARSGAPPSAAPWGWSFPTWPAPSPRATTPIRRSPSSKAPG